MRLPIRLSLTLLCAVLALPAFAQRQKSMVPDLDEEGRKGDMARLAQEKANERFDAADEDRSGTLSKAEVSKHLTYMGENFERYDKNKDGALSWEEFIGHDRWQRAMKPKSGEAAAK